MSIQDRPRVIEEEFSLRISDDGTPSICLGKRIMQKAGYDPDSGEVPDTLTLQYNTGGDRDGVLEIDLQGNDEQ